MKSLLVILLIRSDTSSDVGSTDGHIPERPKLVEAPVRIIGILSVEVTLPVYQHGVPQVTAGKVHQLRMPAPMTVIFLEDSVIGYKVSLKLDSGKGETMQSSYSCESHKLKG